MSETTNGLEHVMAEMFYMPPDARLQDPKNRQNSVITDDQNLTKKMHEEMYMAYEVAIVAYNRLIEMGIAKEIARFVLPQGVYTRLYITGNARSFIHYCDVRDEEGVVQWEHVEVARAIKSVFSSVCPVITKSVWN